MEYRIIGEHRSPAFGTVAHNLSLNGFKVLAGISGSLLEWFSSNLSDWTFSVWQPSSPVPLFLQPVGFCKIQSFHNWTISFLCSSISICLSVFLITFNDILITSSFLLNLTYFTGYQKWVSDSSKKTDIMIIVHLKIKKSVKWLLLFAQLLNPACVILV